LFSTIVISLNPYSFISDGHCLLPLLFKLQVDKRENPSSHDLDVIKDQHNEHVYSECITNRGLNLVLNRHLKLAMQ